MKMISLKRSACTDAARKGIAAFLEQKKPEFEKKA